ncbi:MAG: 3-dehydroquinate synthase [Bacteroidales bacterium]|nr:3-dehydroquinate synthase [Candidatus Colimorpha onthohippi]
MIILPDSKLSPLARLQRHLRGQRYREAKYFIFVDANSYEHCLPQLVASVDALQEAEFIELPVGEDAKCVEVAHQVWQSLSDSGADRQSVIVNLGGGCVSDLGGFVAATYMRGIRYINIPTTLVGMVDAALGGKTALNVGNVKNAVGVFAQPDTVCVDTRWISSLGQESLKAGSVELLKTLLVAGCDVPLTQYTDLLTSANISQAATAKMAVVKYDRYDKSARHILNFGHTFGHAIESHSIATGVPLSHGLAVAIGLQCALYLSVKKLGLDSQLYDDYIRWQQSVVKSPVYSLNDTEAILQYMRKDKKNSEGNINCVLLRALGEAVIDVAVDELEIRDALLKLK